jgi:sirohydrochlorin cobaltochelatase
VSPSLPIEGRILLAHGSRDPSWQGGMEAVAAQLREGGTPCCCAYVELCAPNLLEAAQDLVRQGCTRLAVTPMFLGLGRHAREDIPQLVADLRRALPEVPVQLQPALCDRPDFAAMVARFIADH